MKTISTRLMASLLLAAVALVLPQQASAQDDVEMTGYANIYVRVKAAPQGGGQVFPFYQESTVKAWRDSWDFKQPVAVGSILNSPFTILYLYAKPNEAEGYAFGGWYLDDGDGVFDMDKDELMGETPEYISMAALDDDVTIYETQSAAKAGAFPDAPTDIIFAYFTRGAQVSLSYYQDNYLDLHANCGTVWISKVANEPGDQVTVRAIPNDGYHFEYWQDSLQMGNIVSRDNPYTFTVKGGEHLYAYFMADDGPVFHLPEEGGFAVANVGASWVLCDESVKNGALVLVMEAEDLRRTADGKIYLDMANEDSHINVTQHQGAPSIVYGKGDVRFAYKIPYGIARAGYALVRWSGSQGASVGGDVVYVYVFVPELGAFIQYGTTDSFSPNYSETVRVPANNAYFVMSAYDLTDDYGNIPTVIGLSPETYDKGVAGYQEAFEKLSAVEGVRMDEKTLKGVKVYTLSGIEVKTTSEPGVFIVGGRKVVVK